MIDTLIHLLEPDRFTYAWTAGFPTLAGRFDLSDYQKNAESLGIQVGVFMEVDCDESAAESWIGGAWTTREPYNSSFAYF